MVLPGPDSYGSSLIAGFRRRACPNISGIDGAGHRNDAPAVRMCVCVREESDGRVGVEVLKQAHKCTRARDCARLMAIKWRTRRDTSSWYTQCVHALAQEV